MAIYKAPNRRAGPRLFWVPTCFTNNDKAVFWAYAVGGEAFSGALIGLLVGIVVTVGFGPELEVIGIGPALRALINTVGVKAAVGVGAIVGAVYGFWLAWKAACPECGSCVEILHYQTGWPLSVWRSLILVVPIVARPSTADCSIIPPGCP